MNDSLEELNRILYLHILNRQNDDYLISLTCQDIVNLASSFGEISKVLIFSRDSSIKAFVEFSDPNKASSFMHYIDQTLLNDWGFTRVFSSDRKELKCMRKSSNYWEKSSQSQSTTISLPSMMSLVDNKDNYTPSKIKSLFSLDQDSLNEFISKGNIKTIDACTKTTTPSKVILVSNLEHYFESIAQIYNIFKCFGVVLKILYLQNLQKCFIEYQNINESSLAIYNLNHKVLDKIALKVSFSKFATLDLNKPKNQEIIYKYNKTLDRTDSQLEEESYNKPSTNVKIKIPKTKSTSIANILLAINQDIQKISPNSKKTSQSFSEKDTVDIIYQNSTVQNSYFLIKNLHNKQILGVNISIFFY